MLCGLCSLAHFPKRHPLFPCPPLATNKVAVTELVSFNLHQSSFLSPQMSFSSLFADLFRMINFPEVIIFFRTFQFWFANLKIWWSESANSSSKSGWWGERNGDQTDGIWEEQQHIVLPHNYLSCAESRNWNNHFWHFIAEGMKLPQHKLCSCIMTLVFCIFSSRFSFFTKYDSWQKFWVNSWNPVYASWMDHTWVLAFYIDQGRKELAP